VTEIPAKIAQLADYWRSLGDGAAPERHLLDPAAITPLLPYVLLIDFEDEPFRVRYRLTGTKVDEMTGINITGRYLDEFAQEPYRAAIEGIERCYRTCRSTGQAIVETYLWPNEGGLWRQVWMGLFPLKINGEIRQCISIEDYGALGPHPDLVNWREALPEGG
jgi:hypothetical protein